jgi:hypothetical protein
MKIKQGQPTNRDRCEIRHARMGGVVRFIILGRVSVLHPDFEQKLTSALKKDGFEPMRRDRHHNLMFQGKESSTGWLDWLVDFANKNGFLVSDDVGSDDW